MREIESCFMSFSVSGKTRDEVLKLLFESPYENYTKQFLLKENFNSVQALQDALKKVTTNERLIADICSLFQVDDDLELPPPLKEQLNHGEKIAVISGAGVSKLLGCPLWDELSTKAIMYLFKKNSLTFAEAEKIIAEKSSPKLKMSIFHDILPKNLAQDFYEEVLKRTEEQNPYDDLVKLNIPKFTLNIDHHFFDALEKKYINDGQKGYRPIHRYKKDDFKDDDDTTIINHCVYQIHGSYKNLSGYSIITMRDYLDHYYRSAELNKFLKRVFSDYACVFIGCGMEEFEILEGLIKDSKQHHVLLGTYLGDTNLFRIRKKYFKNTLGINAYGYYLDFTGYKRLLNVIDSWVKKINLEMSGGFYPQTEGEFGDIKF